MASTGLKRARSDISTDMYNFDRLPVNNALSVIPTEGESQYEAYQSIFATIMSAHDIPLISGDSQNEMTPYELLCFKNRIPLYPLKNNKFINGDGIYFKPSDITHYIAYKEKTVLNPYFKYQAKNTQGFCQMFAFFMYISNTADFKIVDQTKKIDIDNFNKLVENTYECGLKSIKYIESDRDLFIKFKNDFDDIVNDEESRKNAGINIGTTVEQYFSEFKSLPIKAAMYYIHDQPLVGYEQGVNKNGIWDILELGNSKKAGRRKTRRRNLLHVKRKRSLLTRKTTNQ